MSGCFVVGTRLSTWLEPPILAKFGKDTSRIACNFCHYFPPMALISTLVAVPGSQGLSLPSQAASCFTLWNQTVEKRRFLERLGGSAVPT